MTFFIHKAWFAPEFKGSVGKPGFPAKDIMFAYLEFSAMLIIMDISNLVTNEVALVMAALGTALMAYTFYCIFNFGSFWSYSLFKSTQGSCVK